MRKFLKLLFSRIVLFSLLIVLQLAVLIYFIVNFSLASIWVYVICFLASIAAVLWLVTKDDNPSYKITWIILIMALPILGGFFYLAFGNKILPLGTRQRQEKHREEEPSLYACPEGAAERFHELCPEYVMEGDYIRRIAQFPPFENTSIDYCPLGEDFFRHLREELPRARHFIFMEYFIIEKGEMWSAVLDILKERAAAGVEVCVLYDDFGCIQRLPLCYIKELESYNIRATVFNRFHPAVDPSLNYRDHRKLCVIDGTVGFCGGLNIADEYINAVQRFGHWKDTAVMLRGEAVQSLTRMFLQVWTMLRPGSLLRPCGEYLLSPPVRAEGFVQPYADSPLDRFNVAKSVYMQIINRADRYVYITTPYLVLDNEMVVALKMAAESGIDVRIITPHHPDKWYVHMVSQSYYQTLIKSGVRIYEYLPGFIHAKMFVSDDACAVVGTANLDYRSLYLHYENNVIFYRHPAVMDVKNDIVETLGKCRQMELDELKKKIRGKSVLVALLKLCAPLM